MDMINGALVLEGGSMRCLFTAGVLDVFLEQEMNFSYVIGVSAGSMTGLSYVSRQPGRTRDVTIGFVNDSRYLSFRRMMKKRQIFNFDFLFGELSHELIPFDWETFNRSPQRYVAVATRCKTGQPEYFEKGRCSDLEAAVAATLEEMMVLFRVLQVLMEVIAILDLTRLSGTGSRLKIIKDRMLTVYVNLLLLVTGMLR